VTLSISINIIKYYGKFYPEPALPEISTWWFCRNDESIVALNDLFQHFGYTSLKEIQQSDAFIPLFRTNMVTVEHEFLDAYNLNDAIEEIESEGDFDTGFKIYIDNHRLSAQWHEYEGNRLKEDAINWCHINGIKFIDRLELKPVKERGHGLPV
jgi:hypothetical protein